METKNKKMMAMSSFGVPWCKIRKTLKNPAHLPQLRESWTNPKLGQ
jgi:hypothetical protein